SVFIVPIKVNSTHKNSVNHTINTVIPRVNSPISFEGFKVELNFLLQQILIFNVQSAYTLFARQETQKIRKLSSGIRKLTDLFLYTVR
ncbi:MAG: hypothetical protein MR840_06770, partial [Solobacterium sp.]|nr:hypothetical protein [Solobacterium sp.]